jgi:hypothetical protein
MKRIIASLSFILLLSTTNTIVYAQLSKNKTADKEKIDLSGRWSYQLDSLGKGIEKHWYSHKLTGNLILPGSLTTNGIGNDITVHTPWTGTIEDSTWFHAAQYAQYRKPGNIKVPFWLQPVKYYKGAAWYSKEVNIPASWQGKYVELYIERSHWETTLWIDGQQAGRQNSLATAHVFDLSNLLKSGHHQITIRVDNRIKDIDVGQNSHSVSDHTQGNWNGMIGRLFLEARPPVYIDDVQLYPDLKKHQVVARIRVNNITGKTIDAHIRLAAVSENPNAEKLNAITRTQKIGKSGLIEVAYPMGEKPLLWSEFHPDIYKMRISLSSDVPGADQKSVIFGMREFSTRGTQFTINGQLTMLRGTLECAEFPKTGYPPTDLNSWMREFKICKSYGLNHIRFHSWCPPDAAFEAADRLGLYLHIECDSWANEGPTLGDGKPIDQYIYDESRSIVKAYGNHPSFCMMAYGNEPAGDNLVKYLTGFVNYWKKRDPRRLYTTGSGWPLIDESDYNSNPLPRIQLWGAGLKSVINDEPPRNDYDWADVIKNQKQPTVSHEIGQWCVYPDFTEIVKYNGILKAKNFEIFRDNLEKNGMGNLAGKFLYASGKLQALCYKADIEAALRTPGFGGFQLLGLYDFPGQGTALVGVLNAFWQDKGYINGPEYSKFCNSVVPLVRLPKMVYLDNEQVIAPVEIAQFGPGVLHNVTPVWNIKNDKGEVLFKGALAETTVPFGNGIKLGVIKQSLAAITKPSKLSLTVAVAGHQNTWEIFVYPSGLPATNPEIMVTQTLDKKAIETLHNGGKVLLTLKKGAIRDDKGGDIAIGFSSIFWNTAWTHVQPPVTLGILCDPKHPALKEFPTQSYSNWQWWDAMTHSNAIRLDSVAKDLHPIVRVIDDWFTARPLGLIFECRVGKGKLIVSGIDLLDEQEKRPEARQLLYSLKNYMSTDSFSPASVVDIQKIASLFK